MVRLLMDPLTMVKCACEAVEICPGLCVCAGLRGADTGGVAAADG